MEDLQLELEQIRKKRQELTERNTAQKKAIKDLKPTQTTVSQGPIKTKLDQNSFEIFEVPLNEIPKYSRDTQPDPDFFLNSSPSKTGNQNIVELSVCDSAILYDSPEINDKDFFQSKNHIEGSNFDSSQDSFNPICVFPKQNGHFPTACDFVENEYLISVSTNLHNKGHGEIYLGDICSNPKTLSDTQLFNVFSQPSTISFTPNYFSEYTFLAGGQTGLLFLFDKRSGSNSILQSQRWKKCHYSQIISTLFLDSKTVLSISRDGTAFIWDLAKLDNGPRPLDGNVNTPNYNVLPTSKPISPTTACLVENGCIYGFVDGSVRIQPRSQMAQQILNDPIIQRDCSITGLDYYNGGNLYEYALAVSSIDGVAEVWSYDSNKLKCTKKIESLAESYVACGWRGRTYQLGIALSNGVIELHEIKSGKKWETKLDQMASCMKFSSSGKALCVGLINGGVSILSCPSVEY